MKVYGFFFVLWFVMFGVLFLGVPYVQRERRSAEVRNGVWFIEFTSRVGRARHPQRSGEERCTGCLLAQALGVSGSFARTRPQPAASCFFFTARLVVLRRGASEILGKEPNGATPEPPFPWWQLHAIVEGFEEQSYCTELLRGWNGGRTAGTGCRRCTKVPWVSAPSMYIGGIYHALFNISTYV